VISRRTLICALAVAAALPAQAEGQAGRSQVEEGNRLYSEGRFDEAHQKYLEALLEAPGSPLIHFNDGNALYQSRDFQRAMEAYREAVETGDPALAGSAWYNLGNALYRAQMLQESLEAYKQALRANPSDPDAKHNLERVLEQLQQEEEQQQQEGEDQDRQDPQSQDSPESQGEQPPPEEEGQQEEGQQEDEQPQPQDAPREQKPQEEQGQPEPQAGDMTQEEAQRLLDAIQEDPGDVNRRPASARGRRPRKDW
jgi:Ca-activated chloride channel family protein